MAVDEEELIRLLGFGSVPLSTYAVRLIEGPLTDRLRERLYVTLEEADTELAGLVLEKLEELDPKPLEESLRRALKVPGVARWQALRAWGEKVTEDRDSFFGELVEGEQDPFFLASVLTELGRGESPWEGALAEKVRALLGHADPRVRANAVEACLQRDPHPPRVKLQDLLSDPVPRVRAAVAVALWNEDPSEVEAKLRADLESKNAKSRIAALYCLGKIADFPDGRALLESFLGDPAQPIRLMAVRSLKVHQEALEGRRLAAFFMAEGSLACRRDLARRAEAGPREDFVSELLRVLSKETDPRRKSVALKGIAWTGSEADESKLLPFVLDPDDRVRADTFEALGEIGGEKITPLLHHGLTDRAPRVQANSALALFRRGGQDMVDVLLGWLRGPDRARAASAAFALGEIGANLLVDPLAETVERLHLESRLDLQDRSLLKQVTRALAKIRDPREVTGEEAI